MCEAGSEEDDETVTSKVVATVGIDDSHRVGSDQIVASMPTDPPDPRHAGACGERDGPLGGSTRKIRINSLLLLLGHGGGFEGCSI